MEKKQIRIAVFVSGGGTNLQALIDAEKRGEIKSGKLALVVSNNPSAYALTRAADNGIKSVVISKKTEGSKEAMEEAMVRTLTENGIDLIVLAGFMCILSADFTRRYDKRILNIHPSLIPSFCGEGFYGLHVHEAALQKGVKVTGATVHYVNEIPDGGEIILQKAVDVEETDTPEILQKRVMEQLKDLGMERTRFEVRFTRRDAIGPEGAEDVEFMISPNPGEPLRPLAQIASGGEISRFMLALKVILAASDGIQTMIFDEIDTGISGRMAQIVGEKMSVLGADRQVICVTHLAQIAALADTQFVVEKHVANEKTTSTVLRLDDEGRLKEIARLVGGADTLDSGLTHARRMLDSAKARTKELRSAL